MKTKQYIGKKVKVVIDRPLGSSHPSFPTSIYPINYGYLPNTISGDGEELDAYVIGVSHPVKEFEGIVIAVVHRTNDAEDKLVIAPEGKMYTDQQILDFIEFQEKYFQSVLIR